MLAKCMLIGGLWIGHNAEFPVHMNPAAYLMALLLV